MTKIVFLLSAFLILLHRSNGQCLTPDDSRAPSTNSRKNLYTGQQEFSLNLLRAVNQLEPEGNIFFSPYSTYHALLLAYFISGGQTEQFLRKTLRVDASMVSHVVFIYVNASYIKISQHFHFLLGNWNPTRILTHYYYSCEICCWQIAKAINYILICNGCKC